MKSESEENGEGVRVPAGTGTPSPFEPSLGGRRPVQEAPAAGPALDDAAALDFDEALALVAEHASGPLGAERVRARRPLADPAAVETELAPVAELLALAGRGETVDVPAVPPIDGALGRLRVEGSVLSGPELVRIRQTVAAARTVHAELRRVAAEAPTAAGLAVPPPDQALERRLAEAVDDEGELLDTASPRLQKARREIHAARERLVKKLESILGSLDSEAPAGAQVTIRGDRYVIPVRRDSRSRPEGVVHDESASHGTLFIEPTAAIETGNALRSAVLAAEREALAVLRELTERCRPEREALRSAHAMCVAADDLVARVRYATVVRGAVPRVTTGRLDLRGARHPLLLAREVAVVPFDLALEPQERTLLISGPNAGGKTVLLKTVGLTTLLVQAGIVPPLGAGSEVPVYAQVFADIGDHQSLAADLSTFSAHLVTLRKVLERAGPGTLVLMDEVGSGTDPAEGAALARAALTVLTRRGATAIATTHLGALKTLAGDVPGVVNGSLEFDAERLSPTFRFQKGVPGRSYGLAIARRLGLDPEVLNDAEAQVPDRERALDDLLSQVETRARRLEGWETSLEARQASVTLREESTEARETLQRAREKELTRRERDAEKAGRREARKLLLDARSKVEDTLRQAQALTSAEEARRVRRELEDAARGETDRLEAIEAAEVAELDGGPVEPGQRVRLSAGGVGSVLEIRGDGKALVALGAVKVIVPVSELIPVAGEAPKAPAPRPTMPDPTPSAGEIDLRGFRGDEAEAATLAAVDAAVLGDQPILRIIHGMGTGVVRDRVRRVLQHDRRVARFDFAPRQQGGTGVTIVEFSGG